MTRLQPWAIDLINYVDPDEARTGMVMSEDLMAHVVSREHLRMALANLREVLADQAVTNADLKGRLNRASGRTWGGEYDRVFSPREFLETLAAAVEAYLHKA
ncbi:hypothetical protein [Brevundimonas sp.]|uniref:hypothetical protein n=1 Tax=Brevundimonas sp. TaxID=1871086 RepID=UPI002D2449E3|nr:hypothetical protein [Brevundimonas sp.]HYD26093.1 hypothetical protein [Brevundimonas sp.]